MNVGKTGILCRFFIICILVLVPFSCKETVEKKEKGVPIEELYIGEEPGLYPPVLLYRTRKTQWSIEDVEKWYHYPTEEEQKNLEKIFTEKAEAILDSVP